MDSTPEEYIVNVEKRNSTFKGEAEADLSTKMLFPIEM